MAPSSKPGLLLVQTPMLSCDSDNADAFERWAKLHFRDLLNIPADPSSGAKVEVCVLGRTSPNVFYPKEVFERGGSMPCHIYACFVSDISVLKSKEYYKASQKSNLQQTGPLEKSEEPVAHKNSDKEAASFDIVGCKFVVYEEVADIPESSSLRERLRSPKPTEQTSQEIVRVNVRILPGVDAIKVFQMMQFNLKGYLKSKLIDSEYAITLSFYRWAGKEAQPDELPPLDVKGSADWMILVLFEKSDRESWNTDTLNATRRVLTEDILDSLSPELPLDGRNTMFEIVAWDIDRYS